MKVKALSPKKLEQSIKQYTILVAVVLAIGAYFGYQNFNSYSLINATSNAAQQEVIAKQKIANGLANDYSQLKKDFEDKNTDLYVAINNILPLNEDFTNLARTLDKYFLDNNTDAEPLFLSDLRFSTPELPTDKEYSVLPFTMSVSGNYDAFKKFLEYLQSSGDLNNQTRLMEIASVNFSLTEPTSPTGEETIVSPSSIDLSGKEVNASVSLKAYFKKQNPIK